MVQVVVTGFCSENDIPMYNGKFKNTDNATAKVNELIKQKKIDFAFLRIVGRKKIIKLDNYFVEKEEESNDVSEENSEGKTTKKSNKAKGKTDAETNPLRRYFDEIES